MNDVNLLGVLVASVSSFAFGALWYSPVLFLSAWKVAAEYKGPDAPPARVFIISFICTLLSAFVLAKWLGSSVGLLSALVQGLLVGVGVVAASFGINYQFAGRSTRLWLIDGGFHIFRFSVMAVVYSLF